MGFTIARYVGGDGGNDWNSETFANHVHLVPTRSPPASTYALRFLLSHNQQCQSTVLNRTQFSKVSK